MRAAQAKSSAAAAIAAGVAAEGFDSDEEVYATAAALAGDGAGDDEAVAAKVRLAVRGGSPRCICRQGRAHTCPPDDMPPRRVLHCLRASPAPPHQLAAQQRRGIDPLAPVDHSLIEYDDFAKDFYSEHPAIAGMSEQQVCHVCVWMPAQG